MVSLPVGLPCVQTWHDTIALIQPSTSNSPTSSVARNSFGEREILSWVMWEKSSRWLHELHFDFLFGDYLMFRSLCAERGSEYAVTSCWIGMQRSCSGVVTGDQLSGVLLQQRWKWVGTEPEIREFCLRGFYSWLIFACELCESGRCSLPWGFSDRCCGGWTVV